tara:strand:- start:389 stop:586 length:198 start_codon:yes stop_codon:yes gene_type:complete
MLVQFKNSGYQTVGDKKDVNVVNMQLCEFRGSPQLKIENPWWTGETLIADWAEHDGVMQWVCDLD